MSSLTFALVATAAPAAAGDVGDAARERIEAFVEAFNSGNADTFLRFYEKGATEGFRSRRSDEEDRELYRMLYGDMGALTLRELRSEGPGKVRASFASAEIPMPVTFVFRLVGEAAPKIDGFSVEVGGPDMSRSELPPLELDAAADPAAKNSAIGSYLRGLAERGIFSGSVFVAMDGKGVFHGQYGLANREQGVPVDENTRFDVGSITKSFTKVAVGQLLRDGKLALTDTIAKHLPEYPNREVAGKVTVRHLLDHSSGLGDIFNPRWDGFDKTSLLTPEDFFPLFASDPLRFEPGVKRAYSNAGYIVLGAIVEAASGVPYDRYVAKKIFAPAGMKRSGFPLRDASDPALAIGYTRRGPAGPSEAWRRNLDMLAIKGCPAGSSFHTAEDLWRFDRALRSGKLLGPGWTEWVFTDKVPLPAETKRPLQAPVGHGFGIAGGAPGVSAGLESEGDDAVIVLANLDEPIAEELALTIRRALTAPE